MPLRPISTAADPGFEAGDLELLDPSTSLARRQTPGAGTPDSVRVQIAKIRSQVRGLKPEV